MQSFYVPWVGPDKFRVWVLITILTVALFTCLLWIPVATCSANDDSGVCAPAVYPPELPGLYTVGTPMWRTCQCNASVVVRTSANARTLSNTVFANGDLPPTPEARGLNALTVSVLQFVLNDVSGPAWDGSTLYDIPIPSPDPFFATPANISIPNWVTSPDGSWCPNPVMYTTPFIDLSNVYGVNGTALDLYLRAGRGGQMLVDAYDEALLPYAGAGSPFLLADPRDGYTADLIALHTLLVLNHNSWAMRVSTLHGEWTDDQLFWKARQLNVAEWQFILFHEWLPSLLGTQAPPPVSPFTTAETVTLAPAAVRLEVATVLVPALIDTLTPATYGPLTWQAQHGVVNAATVIQQAGSVTSMLTALIKTPALAFDDRVINGRRNLYWNGTQPEDLVAEHVQRPRILRVPDWAAIYTCFGTQPIAGDPRDAYQGFLEEAIYPGSSIGLTAANLLGQELGRLRDADPNFYHFQRKAIGQIYWKDLQHSNMRGLLSRNAALSYSDLGGAENVFFTPGARGPSQGGGK
jgi:peroxidase